MCQAEEVPRFSPFRALRYAAPVLDDLIAPPYDVLSEADVDELAARHEHNIVHVDVPRERDGSERYVQAATRLSSWMDEGVLVPDSEPSFTIYRMRFRDEIGNERSIVGAVGGLEVTDESAGGVLPHERVTPKASTDRLDLTRATRANLSPVWGLALAPGLTSLLGQPGEPVGSVKVDGVEHSVERVTDAERLRAISDVVAGDDVLMADGHHRYGVARQFRDEVRTNTGRTDTPAEETLAFVSELIADQLNVQPIHRLYAGVSEADLVGALSREFDLVEAGAADSGFVDTVTAEPRLSLVTRDGAAWWLQPRPGAFAGMRALDGLWLEHALDSLSPDIRYQHGAALAVEAVRSGAATAAVLTRAVTIDEIALTAREHLLMPPKSTFFTPKLRTGFVLRPLTEDRT